MTYVLEGPVTANAAGVSRSTTTASARPYLTAGDVLRAGMRRTAERRQTAAAESTWDSEGGAADQRTKHGEHGTGVLVPAALETPGRMAP
ncbi:hypothetical protein MTY59_24200 [Mycobacterium senriense]|uniref:Uncharacterized protein n=1 Tax=Mycobacterium senriense TaxID=2775496 RepID=A0ABM7SMS4_9MYCO|nr:hypothetical protein MTY59_24200 [Mycobacterium senriense]